MSVPDNAAWVLLHPLDVLTFRDGRPFTAGVAATGRTTLPRPSTLGGAIGAAFGRDPERITGPVLVRTDGGRHRVLLPAPADLVLDDDGDTRRLGPPDDDAMPAGVTTDLAAAGGPPGLAYGQGDAPGTFLDARSVERYLDLDPSDAADALAAGDTDVLRREKRLGIARQPRSAAGGGGRTTVPGLLYQAEYWRPTEEIRAGPGGATDGVAFAVRVVFDGPLPAVRSNLVRLGGEARQATVTVVPDPPPPNGPGTTGAGRGVPALPRPADVSAGRVLLYLATPALFVDGWRPPLPAGCALVGACTFGPEVVTGISGATGKGRALRWGVGAGSVYYLRFDDGAAARAWAGDVHGQCLEQAEQWMRTVGFGMCLVGRW